MISTSMEQKRQSEYAPHPGAMSGDIWPMSLQEMTQQLLSARSSRNSALIGESLYDNKVEAARGAAALINASYPGGGPFPPTPMRSQTVPIMSTGSSLAPPLDLGDKRSSRAPPPAPLRMSTCPPRRNTDSQLPLPTVVLTPPPGR
ncbi:uncharacterized protein EHS24_007115 [Apiotrichum porosum]|uniref:Uncharacterized protein n=1 Tax=Apiotrichum porosum TaxID=105984 RepID=A0A427XXA0_9TREE|nr:uncharacterized protein EHS24_007115 [Apiotrichum porosum]RSH83431.1 hypothetical protein EHS24_007115 [Apiotrichum porosum]